MSNDTGFGSRESITYINIRDAKLAVEVKEGTPKAVSHTVTRGKNAGKVKWYREYDHFTGRIQSVSLKESPFSKGQKIITIRFKSASLDLNLNSSYAKSFIIKCRNINLKEEVQIAPWKTESAKDASKYYTGLSLYQKGNKLENYLDPKEDLPALVKLKKPIAGREYDDSDQIEYLEKHITQWITDNNLSTKSSFFQSTDNRDEDDEESGSSHSDEDDEESNNNDNLPF